MTAWTNAIDAQLAILDARAIAEAAQRVYLVTRLSQITNPSDQRAVELQRAIDILDESITERVVWRARLVEARGLGYLPDPNSRFYNEDQGGFLQ